MYWDVIQLHANKIQYSAVAYMSLPWYQGYKWLSVELHHVGCEGCWERATEPHLCLFVLLGACSSIPVLTSWHGPSEPSPDVNFRGAQKGILSTIPYTVDAALLGRRLSGTSVLLGHFGQEWNWASISACITSLVNRDKKISLYWVNAFA